MNKFSILSFALALSSAPIAYAQILLLHRYGVLSLLGLYAVCNNQIHDSGYAAFDWLRVEPLKE